MWAVIVTSDTCAHAQGVLLPRVQTLPWRQRLSVLSAIFGAAAQHGAKRRTSIVSQRPSSNVGKWESGTHRGSKRQRQPGKTGTQTARRQQSDRGAGGSMGRRGEGKSCGSSGTRRGHGVQMSGWLAPCCIHLLCVRSRFKLVTGNPAGS